MSGPCPASVPASTAPSLVVSVNDRPPMSSAGGARRDRRAISMPTAPTAAAAATVPATPATIRLRLTPVHGGTRHLTRRAPSPPSEPPAHPLVGHRGRDGVAAVELAE